ncbi:hypothetical protein PFZ59_00610 [Streptococcus suis]|uniref:hypothetical protein n=1 Tax=Streptococcus suis TaxID=1307 RepID=UPI00240DED8A|nr:hypothetical protein [Streptococcus suis]WFA76031.1 hypothetical protein PFZ59_00610 [Streptococcus suis]
MSAIFKNKKKLTEAYSLILDYDKELNRLRKENNILKRNLSDLEFFNNNNRIIIFCQPIRNTILIISVTYKLDYKKRIKNLYFKINDLSNPIRSNLLNFLDIDVCYGGEFDTLEHLIIQDFIIKTPNKGFGSLLLREALFHISQLFGEYVKITGLLSPVDEEDSDNKNRRDHVYQKFGFEIDGSYIKITAIPLDKIAEERQKWNN